MALVDLLLQHPDVVQQPRGSGDAKAWCPNHPDKQGGNPSLGINAKKEVVKCWVCGFTGTRALAKAWGIEDPDKDRRMRKAPEPFLSAKAAMEQLREAYGLRPETIAHFKIEADPDTPSPSRDTRGAWKYRTHLNKGELRFKAFDRTSKPKYWWGRGTDKNALRTTMYGMEEAAGHETVYLVNGEPSVWVCWQAGIPAVCAFGEGNLSEESVRRIGDLGVQEIRIVLDLDQAGEASTSRAADIIQSAGLVASAAQLPSELGQHGDVADLYLWCRADDEAFKQALAALPDKEVSGPDPLKDSRFFQRDGRFFLRQPTKDGQIDVALTNFTAWAEEEVVVDDGWDQALHISFTGQLASGRRLPAVQVPAARVHNLDWIADKWGYTPTIRAGAGSKDNVREIMQRLSEGRGLTRRAVYGHTGWRQIEGQWRFLMPGGAVGTSDVDVEMGTSYQRYWLPSEPSDPHEAVRASLRFLDVAQRQVTLPLFAFAYLAPLQSLLSPAFSLWLRADTGSFKSTLAALLLSHFGAFQFNTPPVTWEATARGIERYLFDLKDVLGWIDDFNPRQAEREMSTQYAKADGVLRSLGNLQGRIRMRADLSLQRTYLPRALLISTGEIYPSGESVVARTLAIESSRGAVKRNELSAAQQEADLYPHAMAAYILWLADQYDSLGPEIQHSYLLLRDRATEDDDKNHARTPGAIAHLQVAMELFTRFAQEVGAATREEMEGLQEEAWACFLSLGEQQGARLLEENVVDRYLQVLDTLLAQGKVEFHEKGSDSHPTYGTDFLGWYDTEFLYVDTAAAFNRVSRFFRDEGRTLGATEPTLRRALFEQQILVRRDEDSKHLTSRLRVNGRVHRVAALRLDRLHFAAHFRKLKL